MTGTSSRWLYGKWGVLERSVGRFLRDLVYPEGALCCACGRITDGQGLCPACRKELEREGYVFSWDREEIAPGVIAWGLRPHRGIHRTLVLRLKHGTEARAAALLADLILPLPEGIEFPPETVVTWVTMPASRRRERAIDHGELLARAVAERLGLSCRPLLKRRDTGAKPQARLSAGERVRNLQDVFEAAGTVDFPVLLIDDVRTTGTTAARCAEALQKAGAPRVTAVTMTYAVGKDGK